MTSPETKVKLGPLQQDMYLDEVPEELLRPLENLNGDAEALLTRVLGQDRILARLQKLSRRMAKSSNLEEASEGIIDEFRGLSTEYASYHQLRDMLGDMMVVLSPANVDQIYKAATKDPGPTHYRVKPDGIILQQRGYETFIAGSSEYTCSARDSKERQLNGYQNGEVASFILFDRTPAFQNVLANEIHRMYPQLPQHLSYDHESFETLLTRPADAPEIEVPDNRTVLPLPLTHEEITNTATSLIKSFYHSQNY